MEQGIPPEEEIEAVLKARHGARLHSEFAKASVAICGLGGLGSHVAMALARAGVGRLHLIDFDSVDLSNIHRQQYRLSQIGKKKTEALCENIKEIAPQITVLLDTVRIEEENLVKLLKQDAVICEAFDDAEAKAMLVNGVLEQFPDKYVVTASGMAGIASANSIKTRRITEHFYLCGDEVSGVTEQMGLFAPRVMLCAAHQAHMILRILAKEYEN